MRRGSTGGRSHGGSRAPAALAARTVTARAVVGDAGTASGARRGRRRARSSRPWILDSLVTASLVRVPRERPAGPPRPVARLRPAARAVGLTLARRRSPVRGGPLAAAGAGRGEQGAERQRHLPRDAARRRHHVVAGDPASCRTARCRCTRASSSSRRRSCRRRRCSRTGSGPVGRRWDPDARGARRGGAPGRRDGRRDHPRAVLGGRLPGRRGVRDGRAVHAVRCPGPGPHAGDGRDAVDGRVRARAASAAGALRTAVVAAASCGAPADRGDGRRDGVRVLPDHRRRPPDPAGLRRDGGSGRSPTGTAATSST